MSSPGYPSNPPAGAAPPGAAEAVAVDGSQAADATRAAHAAHAARGRHRRLAAVLDALGAVRDLGRSNLLLLTTLGAVDGTIFLLAAGGTLSTWSGAVVAGLTVVGGAGAWVTAREEFGRGGLTGRDRLRLALTAAVAITATLAAALVGALLAGRVDLQVLPTAAGVVILLVAVEVAGLGLPRLRGLPLPVAVLVGAVLVEGLLGLAAILPWEGVA